MLLYMYLCVKVSSLTYVCPCLFFFRIDIDQPITVLASSRVKAAYQIAQNNNTSFQMSPLIDLELTDEDSPTNSPKAGSESKEESESEPEEEGKGYGTATPASDKQIAGDAARERNILAKENAEKLAAKGKEQVAKLAAKRKRPDTQVDASEED